jgi:hypothetical protein
MRKTPIDVCTRQVHICRLAQLLRPSDTTRSVPVFPSFKVSEQVQRIFEADLLARVRIVEDIATESLPEWVRVAASHRPSLHPSPSRSGPCKPIVGHAHQPPASRVFNCIAERFRTCNFQRDSARAESCSPLVVQLPLHAEAHG